MLNYAINFILLFTRSGLLLSELFISLLVVSVHNPSVVLSCDLVSPLLSLLEPLDRFNQLAPGADREDMEDMAWPGIIGMYCTGIIL